MSIYQEHGYESRKDYLKCLAEDYGVPEETVFALASVLGSTEDFDGLVSAVEDAADMFAWEQETELDEDAV